MTDFYIVADDKLSALSKNGGTSLADIDGFLYTNLDKAQEASQPGHLIYKISPIYMGKVIDEESPDTDDYCDGCGYYYAECEC